MKSKQFLPLGSFWIASKRPKFSPQRTAVCISHCHWRRGVCKYFRAEFGQVAYAHAFFWSLQNWYDPEKLIIQHQGPLSSNCCGTNMFLVVGWHVPSPLVIWNFVTKIKKYYPKRTVCIWNKYFTSPRYSSFFFFSLTADKTSTDFEKNQILPGLMLYPDLANKTLLFCSVPGLPFISVEFSPASSRCCQNRFIGAVLTFKVPVNTILKSHLFSSYCHQSKKSSTPLFSSSLNLIKIHACKIGKLTPQIRCDSVQPPAILF